MTLPRCHYGTVGCPNTSDRPHECPRPMPWFGGNASPPTNDTPSGDVRALAQEALERASRTEFGGIFEFGSWCRTNVPALARAVLGATAPAALLPGEVRCAECGVGVRIPFRDENVLDAEGEPAPLCREHGDAFAKQSRAAAASQARAAA